MAPGPIAVKSLLICPTCKIEMRLFGMESENTQRDLYTFECVKCGCLEVRGVRVK
jgi:Zn ribbon nucleic-acid-binding protein